MNTAPRFRLALVTGATSGIGEETAKFLAEKNIALLLTGRNQAKLDELKQELSKQVSVQTVAADIAKREERQKLIEKIHQEAPDLIINNAGIGFYGECLTHETEEQLTIIDTNISALVEIALEAARTLITKQQKGVIMNISSAGAFQAMPYFTTYAASKAFVNSFSEAFDTEVAEHGIRVLALCPGVVTTQFRERASKGILTRHQQPVKNMTPRYVAEEMWKQIEDKQPIKIIDWHYRLMTFLIKYILPKRVVERFIRKQMKARFKPRPIIKI
jgi:short-subunit dehydrogenase